MRDLVLRAERQRRVSSLAEHSDASHIVDICQIVGDGDDDTTRALLCNDGTLVRVDGSGSVAWKCHLDDACAGTRKSDWFSLTMADPGLVCMSKSGAIVTVSPETGQAELVGEFENGIEAGAWSPDRELFLLVTFAEAEHDETAKKSVLLSMNSNWEVLAEVAMENSMASSGSDDFQVSFFGDLMERWLLLVAWTFPTLCARSVYTIVRRWRWTP